jgi:hypothetical protein
MVDKKNKPKPEKDEKEEVIIPEVQTADGDEDQNPGPVGPDIK